MITSDREPTAVSIEKKPRSTTGFRCEATCYILLKVTPANGRQHSREEVETILTADLRLALERFQSARSALFSALLEQAAAASSGACRLEQAKQAKASAAAELRRALRRHNAFILDHQVPEDLANLPARALAAASK